MHLAKKLYIINQLNIFMIFKITILKFYNVYDLILHSKFIYV